uniref:CHK domain-containing protein n=1 Tax=Steinernema glaseri TaxID=37863 RepID=A0A1I7Y1N0_9BILA
VSFGSFDFCPALRKSVTAMPAYQQMDDKYVKLVSYYEKNAGLEIPDVFIFQKVLDSVKTRKDMQDVLPLPTWANDSTFIDHSVEVCEELHTRFIDLILDSTGAWHFNLMVDNINNRIHGNTLQKTYLYASDYVFGIFHVFLFLYS